MPHAHAVQDPRAPLDRIRPRLTGGHLVFPGVDVKREGRLEPFLHGIRPGPALLCAGRDWPSRITPRRHALYLVTSTSKTLCTSS